MYGIAVVLTSGAMDGPDLVDLVVSIFFFLWATELALASTFSCLSATIAELIGHFGMTINPVDFSVCIFCKILGMTPKGGNI